MKKLLFICAAVVLAAACNSGDKYTIKGTVTGDSDKLVNGTAYLFNRDRENPIRDTAEVINGKFVFKGSVTTPEAYLITIDGIPGMISLFLENAAVTQRMNEMKRSSDQELSKVKSKCEKLQGKCRDMKDKLEIGASSKRQLKKQLEEAGAKVEIK